MSDHDATLRRFKPRLKYDSNEAFFADSAAEWTDNPTNTLRRSPSSGELIASARPGAGQAQLDLAFLGGSEYANNSSVANTDSIGCSGGNYREQYVALRAETAATPTGCTDTPRRIGTDSGCSTGSSTSTTTTTSPGASGCTRATGRWFSSGSGRTAFPISRSTHSIASPRLPPGIRSKRSRASPTPRGLRGPRVARLLLPCRLSTRPRPGTTSPTGSGRRPS